MNAMHYPKKKTIKKSPIKISISKKQNYFKKTANFIK